MAHPPDRGAQIPFIHSQATSGSDSTGPASLPFSTSDLPLPVYHPDATPSPDQYWLPPQLRAYEKLPENTRLQEQISQLEQKLKQTQEKKEKYEQKFFEARVAVMGFKCRTMQLQGEVESLRRKLSETQSSGAGPAAPVGTTQQELDTLRRENQRLQMQKQELLRQLQSRGIKEADHTVEELQIQLEKMKIEKITQDEERKNLLSVIGTLEKNMEGMRQDQGKLQRVLWELQQENTALKSHHQQQQQELQARLETVKTEKIAQENEQKNLLTVIETLQKDLQNLQGRRDQDHREMQRLQQIVRELQQENTSLKSQQRQPPSTQDEQQHMWVVRRDEIHLTSRELGRGGWAVVQVAEFRGLTVAAKCLHHAIISPYNRHLFVREMKIASSLRHPNLVQFIGATIEGQPIILTELMESCLRTILERRPLNPAQITSISSDVAKALNYLHLMHPNPIIHRDISSANVLLDGLPSRGWRAKVSDYGSVNYLQRLKTAGPGNPTYAAPEADVPKLQSPKMDVFSYGVLLLEMCSRKFPSAEEREEFLQRVKQPALVDLIQLCLEHEPQRRPDMNQILEHLNKN